MEYYRELISEVSNIKYNIDIAGNEGLEYKVQQLSDAVINLIDRVSELESELKMREVIK